VRYPDGWSIYAVHGVLIPADLIEKPKSITSERIAAEQNAEIRRVMIELRGWPWYLRTTKAQVVDQRKNEIEGTREALMRSRDGLVLVCACPSTARTYALEVPNEVKTCREAQAYLSSGLSDRTISAS
jgi:hypothetical protein